MDVFVKGPKYSACFELKWTDEETLYQYEVVVLEQLSVHIGKKVLPLIIYKNKL